MCGIYERNRIYISPSNQAKIKNYKIILAGAGLGSVIAECALRLGFENICMVDGDVVEMTNLNRQNYTIHDVGKSKVAVLMDRLKSINPHARIEYHNLFLDGYNLKAILQGFNIAINAIDFTSMAPFLFDEVCINQGIPVLHPYNMGWAGCVFVVTKQSKQLTFIKKDYTDFEAQFVKYLVEKLTHEKHDIRWLENCLNEFMNEKEKLSPPQLPVASWITAGMCTHIMYKLAIGRKIKTLPEFYFLSVSGDN